MRQRPLLFWFSRAFLALPCFSIIVASNACSDDDDSSTFRNGSSDGGPNNSFDVFTPPIPPYDGGPPAPPDLIDTTSRLGNATLVVDLGQAIDGPSWRVDDNALYFTVPGQPPSLRRLIADGGVETVPIYDGGGPGSPPYGTANGGRSRLYVTEPNAVVTMVPDGVTPTLSRREGTFALLGDIAAAPRGDAGGSLAFFVDTATQRAYRYDPAAALGSDLVRVLDRDGGAGLRATGIAVGKDDLSKETVYVALSTGATGTIARTQDPLNNGQYLDLGPKSDIALEGTPPNGIALDDQGNIMVAWARGIDFYDSTGFKVGPSPGVPIAAAPTSLTFGGADRKTLYVVTAKGKIYAIPSARPGVLR